MNPNQREGKTKGRIAISFSNVVALYLLLSIFMVPLFLTMEMAFWPAMARLAVACFVQFGPVALLLVLVHRRLRDLRRRQRPPSNDLLRTRKACIVALPALVVGVFLINLEAPYSRRIVETANRSRLEETVRLVCGRCREYARAHHGRWPPSVNQRWIARPLPNGAVLHYWGNGLDRRGEGTPMVLVAAGGKAFGRGAVLGFTDMEANWYNPAALSKRIARENILRARAGLGPLAQARLAPPAAKAHLAGRITLALKSPQPAGEPILMNASLRDTGKKAMLYWCPGPGLYPAASQFVVTATEGGDSRQPRPANGQYVAGSRVGTPINPGTSVVVPLAIAPLPAGVWKLRVGGTESFSFDERTPGKNVPDFPQIGESRRTTMVVKNDPRLAARWEAQLLKKVRAGNAFAAFVATHYQIKSVMQAMLKDMVSTNRKVALDAVVVLFDVRPEPPGFDAATLAAVTRQLAMPAFRINGYLLARLMESAGQQPTDKMLKAVLDVAGTRFPDPRNMQARIIAVSVLNYFPQKAAQIELKKLLHSRRARIRAAAELSLSEHRPM